MTLMRNESKREHANNEMGIYGEERETRRTTIAQGRDKSLELVPIVDISGAGARLLTLRSCKPT